MSRVDEAREFLKKQRLNLANGIYCRASLAFRIDLERAVSDATLALLDALIAEAEDAAKGRAA